MYFDYNPSTCHATSPPSRHCLLIAPLHLPQLPLLHHTDHPLAVGNRHRISNLNCKLTLLLKRFKLGIEGRRRAGPTRRCSRLETLAAADVPLTLIASPIRFVDAMIAGLIPLIISMLSMRRGRRIAAALASSTTTGCPTPAVAALATKRCAATAASRAALLAAST